MADAGETIDDYENQDETRPKGKMKIVVDRERDFSEPRYAKDVITNVEATRTIDPNEALILQNSINELRPIDLMDEDEDNGQSGLGIDLPSLQIKQENLATAEPDMYLQYAEPLLEEVKKEGSDYEEDYETPEERNNNDDESQLSELDDDVSEVPAPEYIIKQELIKKKLQLDFQKKEAERRKNIILKLLEALEIKFKTEQSASNPINSPTIYINQAKELTEKLKGLQKQNDRLIEELNKLKANKDSEITRLQSIVNTDKEIQSNATEEITKLRSEKKQLELNATEQIGKLRSEKKQLELSATEELDKLRTEKKQLELNATEQIGKLRSENLLLKQEIQTLKSNSTEETQQQLTELSQKYEEENLKLKRQAIETINSYETLQKDLKYQLEQKSKEMLEKISLIQTIANQKGDLQRVINEKNIAIESMEATITKLEEAVKQKNNEMITLQQQIGELQQNQSLQNDFERKLNEKEQQINRLKSDFKNIQDQLKQKDQQLFEHEQNKIKNKKNTVAQKSTAPYNPTFASAKSIPIMPSSPVYNKLENIKQDILQLRLNTLARPNSNLSFVNRQLEDKIRQQKKDLLEYQLTNKPYIRI